MGLAIAVGLGLLALGQGYSDNAILNAINEMKQEDESLLVFVVAWLIGSFCLGKIFGGKKTDGQNND